MKQHLYFVLSFLTMSQLLMAAPVKMSHSRASSLQAPKVLPATNVTAEGFTANWEAVAGADGYAVFVTSREEVTADGPKTILYEDFNLISQGSVIEPVFIEEPTVVLDELTMTPDWTVSECILAGGKIGGVIWTPYVDVRADEGKYKVTMTIMGYAGQEISVTSSGSKEVKKTFLLEDNGNNTVTLDFDNGTQDTFLRIVDNGFPDDTEGLYIDKIAYLDDIEVTQQFKAGESVYRLVAVGESESTSLDFEKLPFRFNEKRLYYDLYACSIYYPDPDDPYYYESDYSDFSEKQEVLLEGYGQEDGIADIKADNDTTPVYFDLQGRRMASPDALPGGIYIVKKGDSASKILVK